MPAGMKKPSLSGWDMAKDAAQKMQQPSDDNWLKAAILGGLGGSAESLLSFLEPSPEDSIADAVNPMGMMVKMPSKLAPKFAENFKKVVPQQLEKDGHWQLAQIMEDFAKRYPRAAGNLQEFEASTAADSPPGLYISNIHEGLKGASIGDLENHMGTKLEDIADMGFTAPSNNMMSVNVNAHQGIAKDGGQASAYFSPMDPEATVKHEGTHLAQDMLGRLHRGKDSPYGIRPNEILARLSMQEKPATGQNIIDELLLGLKGYHQPNQHPVGQWLNDGQYALSEIYRRINPQAPWGEAAPREVRSAADAGLRQWLGLTP